MAEAAAAAAGEGPWPSGGSSGSRGRGGAGEQPSEEAAVRPLELPRRLDDELDAVSALVVDAAAARAR